MKIKNHNRRNTKTHLITAITIASAILAIYVVSLKIGDYIATAKLQSTQISVYQDLYKRMFGSNHQQNTLLILANNAELRTGGGFIGTVGMIGAKNSEVETKPLVGVYSIDSSIGCGDNRYFQPTYLKKLSPCPTLRDSANSLDFTSNARQALYYYQQNTNTPVDNVVQITPRALELLLDKTGPIYLKDYDITVTKENFRETVQLEVEKGIDKQQKKDPKSGVLGSLANQMISKLLVKDIYELKDYFSILEQLIDEKQLNIYSKDDKTQALIRRIGADGSVKSSDENYFMMAEANYGANKSSPYIKNRVEMHQTIHKDGTSVIDLTIISNHASDYKFPYIDPNNNANMWLIGDNSSHITLVLPKDTQLFTSSLSADEYSISGDNKTIIEYERYIKPLGQVSESFSYQVPTKYVLGDQAIINNTIQKQLGGWPYELNYSITMPDADYILAATNADQIKQGTSNTSTIYYSTTIDSDRLLSFIYKKADK